VKSKFLQKLSKLWFINSIWMKKKVIFLFIGFQSFVAFSQQKSINQKVEDLLKQMLAVLLDKKYRELLLAEGAKQAKNFSWKKNRRRNTKHI